MKPIIQLINVSRRVTYTGSVFELRNINMTVYPNEIVLLLGRTGSGKTSIFHIIAGFDKPDSGSVYVCGYNVIEKGFSWTLAECVSYMPQKPLLIPGLTVRENVIYATKGESDGSEIVKPIGEQLGLTSIMDKKVSILSGGEQRLASLLVALARNKPILLLDEPTIFLDAERRSYVIQFVASLKRERTVLIATHDPAVLKIADRIYVVEDGKVSETSRHEILRSLYAGNEDGES
ncbi:MAG: ABC transporter ATP-binding protein [Desulfurococcales archaeon]|nr:ABC transporter ATP-binding protein [Desulfurococcales archaeon]